MPQTSAGSKNNPWIAYMRQCAKTFREEQAKAKPPGSKAPPRKPKAPHSSHDQVQAKAQLEEWKERKEARQRELTHASMKKASEHAQKAEAAQKQKRARQSVSK